MSSNTAVPSAGAPLYFRVKGVIPSVPQTEPGRVRVLGVRIQFVRPTGSVLTLYAVGALRYLKMRGG